MTKKEKELYLNRKIAFFYRENYFKVEAVIKDINNYGLLIEVIKVTCNQFYEVGKEYLIPNSTNFVFKFI